MSGRITRSDPMEKLKMKSFFSRKKSRKDSRAPLIETNNNKDTPDRHTALCFDNASVQNNINSLHRGPQSREWICPQPPPQALDRDELCELLEVRPDCLSVRSQGSGLDSGLDSALDFGLIQESVLTHLPQLPSEQSTELQRHLLAVQTSVQRELLRLAPLLDQRQMRVLTQSYHSTVFAQMKELLLTTNSSRTCLQLLHWVLTVCLSQDLFTHPKLNLVQNLDLALYSDWVHEAQGRLLVLLKTDVSSQLGRILDNERQLESCLSEEDYGGTYIDVIKCIDAVPSEVKTFSPELSLKLSLLCLSELLSFLQRYKTHCAEILTKAKSLEPELVTFLKIQKTCKEIKKYVQTKRREDNLSDVSKKIKLLLEEIEAFTLKILLEVLTSCAENGLKKYFKSSHTRSSLMSDLRIFFTPDSWLRMEEHEILMGQCYRLVVSLYSKHLMNHRLHKLKQSWNDDVGASVEEDAGLIHEIFTKLCPGVERWKLLDHISDMLKSSDIDIKKLSIAQIQMESKEKGCPVLVPQMKPMLRWLGLSRSQTREVLSVLDETSELEPVFVKPKTWCCY